MVVKILKKIYKGILVFIGLLIVYLAIIFVMPNKTYPDILAERLKHQIYDMTSVKEYPEEPSAVDAAVLYDDDLYVVSNFDNKTRIVQLLKSGDTQTAFTHTFESEVTLFYYIASSGNIVYATSWGIYCFDPFNTGALLWSVPHMSGTNTYGIMGETPMGIWMNYKTNGDSYALQISDRGTILQQLKIPFVDFYYSECNETGVFFFYNIEVGGDKRKKIQFADWDFHVINEFDLDPITGVIRTTDTNLYTETYRETMSRDKIIKYALGNAKPVHIFDIPDREGNIVPVYVNNVFALENKLFVTANLFSAQNAMIYQFNEKTLQRRYMLTHEPVESLKNIAIIEANSSYISVSQDALNNNQVGRVFVGYMPK